MIRHPSAVSENAPSASGRTVSRRDTIRIRGNIADSGSPVSA
jgi:hypothetical protein